MGEQITYNTQEYLYLKIPKEYSCVYRRLLQTLSSLGIKGLKDCKELSLAYNNITLILDSWNMFQIAIAAYELGEIEKADTIINYINKVMEYCCPKIDRRYEDGDTIFYGEVNSKPNINTILGSREFTFTGSNKLSFPIITTGHFIAVPNIYTVKSIENLSFSGDWLYNTDLNIDIYTKEDIILDEKPYVLWYREFPVPFNAGIIVTLSL